MWYLKIFYFEILLICLKLNVKKNNNEKILVLINIIIFFKLSWFDGNNVFLLKV